VIQVVLYGKPDCHLCDEMKEVVSRVREEVPFALEIVDIERDPALVAAYGHDIPVLFIDGRKAFKHRLDARALKRRLAAVRL
jgi:glutaredoxin